MSASNAFETLLLQHVFQNANIANIGNATGLRGATATGSLYVSLHTGDPGEAGAQNTSEATYTGYARVAVTRSSTGWTISGDTVSNAAVINFGQCTAGSSTVTYFGIGTILSGAGTLLYSSILSGSLSVVIGTIPHFAIGGLSVSVD